MSKATRALGTKLLKGEQAIGGLTSIGGIEITADEIDVTTLDSDGGYREFIGGFKDAGEVPIEGFFDAENEGQLAMETSLDDGLAEDYKISFPTKPPAEWDFKAVVTGFKVGDVDVDGNITFGATLRISGKPNLTVTPEV
ncbi:phage tail tube protein [Schnuerera sp.]|uniref:phage tail tube protein n=1 Tax=Schnuerera sp. TaxID=2794844 RepID=UPI002B79E31D|nr:phage tail tube protein [Schnuerera sp.]HSH35206.1 phage tail tube protein [Schnuerera sp.]